VDYSAETISPSIATPVDFTLEGDPRVELTNELAMEEANATVRQTMLRNENTN
jgi:hypothetical protein